MNPLLGQSSKTLNLLHFETFELQTGSLAAPAPEGRVLLGVMEANLRNKFGGGLGRPPQNNFEDAVAPPNNFEDRVTIFCYKTSSQSYV